MECRIYGIQYISKSEGEFNIRLNNHRKDVHRQNAPQADIHINLPSHNFRQHAKFTLIGQLDNVNLVEDVVTLHLKKCEDFWIKKLKTLHEYSLIAELIFRTSNKKSLYLLFCYSQQMDRLPHWI